MAAYRVALVGAGNIAKHHATVLQRSPNTQIVAVVDPRRSVAAAFAQKLDVAQIYESVDHLIDAGGFDSAHILTPPDLHGRLAMPLLERGHHVLIEKPLDVDVATCRALIAKANATGAVLGVNHNMVFDPVFADFRRQAESGELGAIRRINLTWNRPLPPLTEDMFWLWMLQSSANLLLEQAVHPLSMLVTLGGEPQWVSATPLTTRRLDNATRDITTAWHIEVGFAEWTGSLYYALGEPYDQISIEGLFSDGRLYGDFRRGTVSRDDAGVVGGARDSFAHACRLTRGLLAQTARAVGREYGAALKLTGTNDAFTLSMRHSIEDFYHRISLGDDNAVTSAGTHTVDICRRALQAVPADPAKEQPARQASPHASLPRTVSGLDGCDLVVLGASGTIGRAVTREAIQRGLRVRVLARDVSRLPLDLRAADIECVQGDIADPESLKKAVDGARTVVDATFPKGAADMAGETVKLAEAVGHACLAAGVQRFIFMGTIGSLNMRQHQTIHDATETDPKIGQRNAYARGKALAEQRLFALHRDAGLPVCIVRPGLVVGSDGPFIHPGVGKLAQGRHVIGMGAGTQPLPWIGLNDVVSAVLACVDAPAVVGRAYNLVGDDRLTACEFVARRAAETGRALVYHGRRPLTIHLQNQFKGLVKRLIGRAHVAPTLTDLRNRLMVSAFDNSALRRDTGWRPIESVPAYAPKTRAVARRQAVRGTVSKVSPAPANEPSRQKEAVAAGGLSVGGIHNE